MSKTIPDPLGVSQNQTRLQPLPVEDGPQLAPVLDYLHRVHGDHFAWITFSRKNARDEWHDVGSFRVDELRNPQQPWLPDLLDQLTRDSYVSINGFFRAGVRVTRRTRELYVPGVIEGQNVEVLTTRTSTTVSRVQRNGFRFAHRNMASLRWLNAAWADCDGYNVGLDVEGTVAQLMRHWNTGNIPVPTFLLITGAGVWPFWMVVDERNPAQGDVILGGVQHVANTPCRASGRSVRLLHAINQALAVRLQDCGADPKAIDGARCVRVPGSFHSGAKVRVQVMPVLMAPDFALRAYTLTDLAGFLDVLDAATVTPRRALNNGTLSDAQLQQRNAARRSRYARQLMGIRELEAVRGGFSDGCRNHALLYAALCAYRAGLPNADATQILLSLAARFTPQLQPPQVLAVMRDAGRKAEVSSHGPTYRTLHQHLSVTPAELAQCPNLSPRHRTAKRTATADDRRRTIRLLVGALPAVPSCREMALQLVGHGLTVNPATVSRDYKHLGLVAANANGGRPKPTLF